MNLRELTQRIQAKEARLGVIGLGYVGLPVACKFAETGFDVVGVDVKPERMAKINAGESPIEGKEPGLQELLAAEVAAGRLRATTDYGQLRDRDIVLIAVETPVDEDHVPRYEALRSALRDLGPNLKKGALVIVESTLAPGTMDRVVRPTLEEASGLQAGVGFYVGHCPERVMAGKLLHNLAANSRVVGGMTPETAAAMVALYRHVVQADLDPTDCVTAELVKTVENAYRDVQIAFANEVALICEAVGGDVWEVRELVNKSPGRQMHFPGAGVGGHCIPKDPWLLAYGAGREVPLRVIPAARAVNDGMPLHMVALLEQALAEVGREIAGTRVLVLGYAYLENSDDTRNSPSQVLVRRLRESGAEVAVHDPYVPGYGGDLRSLVEWCDAAVLMVKHDVYTACDLERLLEARSVPVVDGRNAWRGKRFVLLGRSRTGS
ncbi:MAG TPA: nucleotide sugar dehydrogenase [Chloroflexi bacterium]|nr:nucleotide sugar dehydrogenase [Chloroflexota bacterium]